MPQPSPDFFEFLGLRFFPDRGSIERRRDGAIFSIRPKQQALLSVLLSRPGETVTYKELCNIIWPEMPDFGACRRTMTETKSGLDRVMRSILKTQTSVILTISNQGYSIKTAVSARWEDGRFVELTSSSPPDVAVPAASEPAAPVPKTSLPFFLTSPSLFKAHPWHVLGSCAIYSSAFVAVLFLEMAYAAEQPWKLTKLLGPVVFVWVLLTSIGALSIDWKLTTRGSAAGLPLLVLSFIAAALVLYAGLALFLPTMPVTEATFPTQTAQGAYVKNIVLYFLPLAIVFLLIPFHFVVALRKEIVENPAKARNLLLNKRRSSAPSNTVYIQPRTLGLLLLFAGVVALPGNFWLLEHLRAGPNMNRFTLLVMLRLLLYLGLGAESLLWYSRTLNEFKASLN